MAAGGSAGGEEATHRFLFFKSGGILDHQKITQSAFSFRSCCERDTLMWTTRGL